MPPEEAPTQQAGANRFEPSSFRVIRWSSPVTEGTLDFIPLPGAGSDMVGKPAAAKISADGTYDAGTYGDGDGVVPGKKRVTYSAPLPEDSREAEQLKQSQYAGYQIEPSEIDVQAGSGEINFVLVKPTKKK
ncbi:hypothetical protein [Blastopirellula marina]|nr:hypothetical protein [Blastopirellula marina]